MRFFDCVAFALGELHSAQNDIGFSNSAHRSFLEAGADHAMLSTFATTRSASGIWRFSTGML